MRRQLRTLWFALLAGIVIAGCGSGGGDSATPVTKSVTGVASKGPIVNGKVSVYTVDEDGSIGTLLGEDMTTAEGTYNVDIGTYTGNVLVEVSGGEYTDEATGNTKGNSTLSAALAGVSQSVSVAVTPLTEIAVQYAKKTGTLTTSNIEKANSIVSTMIGVDIIGTMPCDATKSSSATKTPDEIAYGLMLASISQMIATGGDYNDVSGVITAIKEDLLDDEGNKLEDTGGKLQSALTSFYVNKYNETGVNDPDLTKLDNAISVITANAINPPDNVTDLNKAKAIVTNLRDTVRSIYNYEGVGVPGAVETPFKNLSDELETKIGPELTDTLDRISWIIEAADLVEPGDTQTISRFGTSYKVKISKSANGVNLSFEGNNSPDLIIDSGTFSVDNPDFPQSGTFDAKFKTSNGDLTAKLNYNGLKENDRYSKITFTGSMNAPGISFDFSQDGRKLEATFAHNPGFYNGYLGIKPAVDTSSIKVIVSPGDVGKTYAVYGGDTQLIMGGDGYHPVDFGYIKLGEATDTHTFSGNHNYYYIVTPGFTPLHVDAVEFSDSTNYGGYPCYWYWSDGGNAADQFNICGIPDNNYVTIGGGGFIDSIPTSVFYSGRIKTQTAQLDGTINFPSIVWAPEATSESYWDWNTWEEKEVCIGEIRPAKASFDGSFEELNNGSPTGVKFSGKLNGNWDNAAAFNGCQGESSSNFPKWDASFDGNIKTASGSTINVFFKAARNTYLEADLSVSYTRTNSDGSKIFLTGNGKYTDGDNSDKITATLTSQDGMVVFIENDTSRQQDNKFTGNIKTPGGAHMADLYTTKGIPTVKYIDNYFESIF